MKKIVALLICLVMVVSAFPMGVFAAETAEDNVSSTVAEEGTSTSAVKYHEQFSFDTAVDGSLASYVSEQLSDSGFTVNGSDTWNVVTEENGNRYVTHKSYTSNGFTFVGEDLLTDATFDLSFRVRMRFNADDSEIATGNITFPLVRISSTSAKSSNTETTNALTVYTNKAADRGENNENLGVLAYNTGGGTAGNTVSSYAVKAETWYSIRLVYDTATNKGTVYVTDGANAPFTMKVSCLSLDSVYQVLLFRGYAKNYLSVDLDDVKMVSYKEKESLKIDSFNDFNSLTYDETTKALSSVPTLSGLTASGTASRYTVTTESGGNQYISMPSGTTVAPLTFKDTDKILHTGDFEVSFDFRVDGKINRESGILSLKEGAKGTEMRLMHAGYTEDTTAIYFGPGATYYMFTLTNDVWYKLTCVVSPATETYKFYVDGELKAYSTLDSDGNYLLYTKYNAETDSWTVKTNPTWGDARVPYGYSLGTAGIQSVYMFHYNTGAFSFDNLCVRSIEADVALNAPNGMSSLYQLNASDMLVGDLRNCCWENSSSVGLSAIGSFGQVSFANGVKAIAPKNGMMQFNLALGDGKIGYLEGGTIWVESEFILPEGGTAAQSTVLAAFDRYTSDGRVAVETLATVDGTGVLSLLGEATSVTLTPGTHTVQLAVSYASRTVNLYIDGSEEIAATATLSEKLANASSTKHYADLIPTYNVNGDVQYLPVSFASTVDVLRVFDTDNMDIRVSRLAVYSVNLSTAEIVGVQKSLTSNSIRILAGVSHLEYGNIGLTFELLSSNGNGWRKVDDRMTNTVYTQILADGETVTAMEEGCNYFIMATINNIDSDAILCVRPYTTKDCVRNYGAAAIYSLKMNDDDLFVEKTTIASPQSSYTTYKEEGFEDANEIFSNYNSDYSETCTKEYKMGGTMANSLVKVGAKTDSARSGEKSMVISGLAPTAEGSFGARIKLNNLLPYNISSYLGYKVRLSAYVKMEDFADSAKTVISRFGIMSDKTVTELTYATYSMTEGEWTLMEFECVITEDLLTNIGSGYPARVFLSLGNSSSNYPSTVYVDDIKVEFKLSVGLTMPSIFADGMVLQRNKTVPVWGWNGEEGDSVKVEIGSYSAMGTVDKNGEFYIELPEMEGASNQTLTVTNLTGGGTLEFTNVGIGEVWYCSGQSNMELKMSSVFDTEEIVANADKYDVRSFKVGVTAAYELQKDVKNGAWKQVTSSNVNGVTAIGYIAAYQLQKELGVPVAIIECYQGGSAAQAWLNYERLFAADREFIYNDPTILPTVRNNWGCEGRTLWEDYDYYWSVGEIYSSANKEGTLIDGAYGSAGERFAPTGFYNAMQGPLANYAIAGVMWYQGESQPNARIPDQYNYLLFDLIDQWREDFKDEDLPVMLVQLAPYSAESGRSFFGIRQVQLDTSKRLENIGVISTAYEGTFDSNDVGGTIHPGTKVPVGNRMAATILGMVYDKAYYEGTTEYTGPVYEYMEISGNKAILHFSHIGDGLKIKDGDTALTGFKISGDGVTFVDATATIVGDTVVVTAASVASPVAVQYSYVNTYAVTGAPDTLGGNLENSIGQPAFPFLATLGDAEIHGATAVSGKVNVEIWERGHNETSYKVIVKVGNVEKEYTVSFETADNNIIVTDIAASAGDSVTVTLKTADGASVIEQSTLTVE